MPIINQIEEMVKNVPGWSPIDQLYTLFNLVILSAHLEGDIVEIGSWCGRSAIVLGSAVKLLNSSKLYCIDLFPEKKDWIQNEDKSYSFTVKSNGKEYEGYHEQTVWQEPFERDIAPIYEKYNGIYDLFLENIKKQNLQDIIVTYKGTSNLFFEGCPDTFKCRLAFLDADHSYDAVCQDIKNVDKYLVKGGWICFDDAFSFYDGVNQAILDLIIENPSYDFCQQMTRKFFIARKKVD
jgi:hypothetical protein